MQKTLKALGAVKERFDELSGLIFAPEIIADSRYWLRLNNERASLEDTALVYEQLKSLLNDYNSFKSDDLLKQIEELAATANELILKDSRRGADAYVEIKPQGKADTQFCNDLIKMYGLYLESNGYDYKQKSSYAFIATGAYELLKYENGVHKSDTGSATVLVLRSLKEQEYSLNEKDIRTDIFHSSGAGGQNVNKVSSAVRLTHMPTGIVVMCQDSRSQLMNKESAHKSLKAKVAEHYKKQSESEYAQNKRERIEEGKEKIRTYNYLANTVTDLRSNVTLPLKQVLEGGIDALIDSVSLLNKREKSWL